ncbi:MAG: hypothetical protein EBU36_07500 [Verrucomicrobia bacterium]|nr:hypothetical protein [Verrucomicrobiota bacterium]
MACVLHGVERLTMDVDVAVMMKERNWERLVAVTEKLGMIPRVPLNPRSLIDPEVRRVVLDEKKAIVFTFLHPDLTSLQLDVFLRPDLAYEALLPGQVQVFQGPAEGKIAAVNRDVPSPDTFDILLLGSDDMIPMVKGYDDVIRQKMTSPVLG